MVEQLLVSLDQLINGMFGKSVADIRNFKEDQDESIDQDNFNKFINQESGEYAKTKKDQLEMFNDVLTFLGDIK